MGEGGYVNMYTGTLVDVVNEATIKAPERPVTGIHHLINARAKQAAARGKGQFEDRGPNVNVFGKNKERSKAFMLSQLREKRLARDDETIS